MGTEGVDWTLTVAPVGTRSGLRTDIRSRNDEVLKSSTGEIPVPSCLCESSTPVLLWMVVIPTDTPHPSTSYPTILGRSRPDGVTEPCSIRVTETRRRVTQDSWVDRTVLRPCFPYTRHRRSEDGGRKVRCKVIVKLTL